MVLGQGSDASDVLFGKGAGVGQSRNLVKSVMVK